MNDLAPTEVRNVNRLPRYKLILNAPKILITPNAQLPFDYRRSALMLEAEDSRRVK